MKHEYHEGVGARKTFEEALTALFCVPKSAVKVKPKPKSKKKGKD